MLPFKVLGLKWVKLDYHNFIISNTSVLLTILLILYWLQGTQSKENVSMFWKTWRKEDPVGKHLPVLSSRYS